MIIKRTNGKKFFDIYEKLSNKVFNINTQYKFVLLKNEIEKDGFIFGIVTTKSRFKDYKSLEELSKKVPTITIYRKISFINTLY